VVSIKKDDNKKPSEEDKRIEEKIEKEIEEKMKELKDRDKKTPPGEEYKKIEREKPLDKEQRKVFDGISQSERVGYIALILVLILITIYLSFEAEKVQNLYDKANTPPEAIGSEIHQTIHDVSFGFEAFAYRPDYDLLVVQLKVENNSDKNFHTTVRAMTLLDKEGNVYYPNVEAVDTSPKFFGEKIEPGDRASTILVFENVKERQPFTLTINNVSNSHNFIWDYALTLPEVD
jgi:hypothetical protein